MEGLTRPFALQRMATKRIFVPTIAVARSAISSTAMIARTVTSSMQLPVRVALVSAATIRVPLQTCSQLWRGDCSGTLATGGSDSFAIAVAGASAARGIALLGVGLCSVAQQCLARPRLARPRLGFGRCCLGWGHSSGVALLGFALASGGSASLGDGWLGVAVPGVPWLLAWHCLVRQVSLDAFPGRLFMAPLGVALLGIASA